MEDEAMLERERQREERRTRAAGDPVGGAQGGTTPSVDYYAAVDNLITSTISADSEAFNQQIEQENGQ